MIRTGIGAELPLTIRDAPGQPLPSIIRTGVANMPLTDPNFGKTQIIRLFDVLLLGPFMVWTAFVPMLPVWARIFMALSGVGTIVLNAYNYLMLSERSLVR